jgi:hypothetical protein
MERCIATSIKYPRFVQSRYVVKYVRTCVGVLPTGYTSMDLCQDVVEAQSKSPETTSDSK